MQKRNIPADRAQRVDEKNGFIYLVIMFTPRLIKMPKMTRFLSFQLMAANKPVNIDLFFYINFANFWDIKCIVPNLILMAQTHELPTEKHSKIPNSLCEMGKIWKYSLRPALKNLNFESMDELGKVRS